MRKIYRILVFTVIVALLTISPCLDGREAGIEAPRTSEEYSEASELAPLPSERTETIARYLAVIITLGVLAIVGASLYGRRKV